jgi:uncharacterized membrane protein
VAFFATDKTFIFSDLIGMLFLKDSYVRLMWFAAVSFGLSDPILLISLIVARDRYFVAYG